MWSPADAFCTQPVNGPRKRSQAGEVPVILRRSEGSRVGVNRDEILSPALRMTITL